MLLEEESYLGVIQILQDILGDYKSHNETKMQISFDCPTCSYEIKNLEKGDGKGNLEINYGFGIYKCWSCGATHNTHGSIFKLIKNYGTKKHIKRYLLVKPDNYFIPKEINQNKKVELPPEYISFYRSSESFKKTIPYKEAYNYLKNRGISDEIIKNNNIGFCHTGNFKGRIIIPSYDDNFNINYFIGRSYYKYSKNKYMNSDVPKKEIIWNEYKIDWDEKIYIVEGVFDSLFLPNAIPLLGKELSDNLLIKLYKNAKKDIVVILDPDAYLNLEKIYNQLNCGNLMGRVSVVKLIGDKDIADLKGNIQNYKETKID